MRARGLLARVVLVGTLLVAGGLSPAPAPAVDTFTCYRAGAASGTAKFPGVPIPPGVSLVDELGASTVSVKPTSGLCTHGSER